jgi:hypothetical protein
LSFPPFIPPKGKPPKLEKKLILINKYYKLIKFILIISLFQRIAKYFIHRTKVILLPTKLQFLFFLISRNAWLG